MKSCFWFRTLGLALAVGLASVLLLFAPAAPSSAQAALKTVIVELESEPVVVAKYRAESAGQGFDVQTYRQQIIAEQDSLLQRVAQAGIEHTLAGVNAPNGDLMADIKFRFNYVYNGVTLVVPEAAIPALKSVAGVKAVHEAETLSATLDRAVSYTHANSLYGTPAHLTQFDTAATNGLHGEGMIVAVVDSGIDWSHAMFGGDPTPPQFGVGPALATRNNKVIYYLNLTAGVAGDDYGHGTHVAADIAGYKGRAPGKDMIPGTADDVELHGVAPQAKIMGYKTLSAVGTGLNPSTIMAVEDAVQPFTLAGHPKPVPHVINLSLGSTVNDPNSPTSVACDNATLAGVTVVASAGNSGPLEATIGSPGTGRRVLTVGANNDPGQPAEDLVFDRLFDTGKPLDLTDVLNPAGVNRTATGLVDGSGKATAAGHRTGIAVNLAGGSPAIGNPIAQYYVFAGTVTTAADVPDSVAGRIAIARPSGAFAAAANSVAAKGAAAVILVRPDLAKVTVGQTVVPTWSIQESDARYLLDLLSSSDAVGVDPAKGALSEFPIRIKQGSFSPAMAAFSSRGPVGGYGQVKPDVTAPGVGILSATVRVGGVSPAPSLMFNPTGYISASGTSFSSPITAGVVALIKQKNPNWTPAMIRAALVNTATNLRQSDGTPVADGTNSVNEQGGGLVDARRAANAKALMGAGSPGAAETSAPPTRPFELGVGPLVGTSPGNPEFSATYSFGSVPIAGVVGTATETTIVNIYDLGQGGGDGVYRLSVANSRGVDGSNFRVELTDPSGNPLDNVEVPFEGAAGFRVRVVASGESIADGAQFQFYVNATRAEGGQTLRMPFYFRAHKPTVTTSAPSLGNVQGTEVAEGTPVDINGSYRLQYAAPAAGTPEQYRIEESKDNGATWTKLADVSDSTLAYDLAGRGNGTYQYRVTGLFPVQYGYVVGPPSAARAVRVDRRAEADVTSLVESVNLSVLYGSDFADIDQALRNKSASTTVYPPARFVVTSINSATGSVRVTNADNNGDGVSTEAVFDYSPQIGPDLAPGETSGARRLRFSNPDSELFTFTAVVRAHLPDAAVGTSSTSTSSGGSAGGGPTPEGDSGDTGSPGSGGTLTGGATQALRFTVNPLTRRVTVQILQR